MDYHETELFLKNSERTKLDSMSLNVGRDRFRLAFRTLNQAVFEQDVS